MNQSEFDAIVVGGGPGGASAAFALGKLGISTLLIDKKPMELIGDKVCGDALSPYYFDRANKEIGLPKPVKSTGSLCEELDHTYLLGERKGSRIVLSEGSATVDRLLYGQELIKSLDEFSSVEVMAETSVKDVIIEGKYVRGLKLKTPDGNQTVKCKIVIDASGLTGAVRKRIPQELAGNRFPNRLDPDEIIVAYREIIRTPQPHPYQNGLYLAYEPEIADVMPGYYWYFSRGECELNIGCGYMTYEKNKGQNIRLINEKVRKRRFPNAEIIKSQGDLIPARLPFPSLVYNGFMMVGDAGALCNPLTGEGHGPAILSGVKAGEIAAESIQKGDQSEQFLWKYNKDMWHEYGTINSWGIAVIKFVNRWGFKTFDWLMAKKIIQEDDILVISSNPDADLKLLSRAKRGFYRPRVLLSLQRMMKIARDIQEHSKKYPDMENFDKWLSELNKITKRKV